ncbi:hypothetical protein FS837_008799 [Tulasnella sp. UAMH 9824]|nr:hypothetical protein FS837_008799 [Tulasnella sp. UAMH 9824]
MGSIPEEIWILIFNAVQDGVPKPSKGGEVDYGLARAASIRPLAETCRTFHRICQPFLFETVAIDYYSKASQRKVDVLRSKPHLCSMVSKVCISWTRMKDWNRELWGKLEIALMELHSVREVWIWGARLSRALFDHFQRCPRLESLVLLNVSTIDAADPTPISLDSLKYLRYEPHRRFGETDFFHAIILPKLETLHIASAFLSDHPAGSFNHGTFRFDPSVLKIEPHPRGGSGVGRVELLQRANRFRSLSLQGVPEFKSSHGFSIPDDLVPELEAFRGRPENVLAFCKGRPVRNVVTWFTRRAKWRMTDHVPNVIQPASAPLEHLSIDRVVWRDGTMEYIARQCPELVTLKIRVKRIKGTLSTRYPMLKLRKATFLSLEGSWFPHGYTSNLKVESEAKVQGCQEFWTRLEYLRLDPHYFWRYRDLTVERIQEEEYVE